MALYSDTLNDPRTTAIYTTVASSALIGVLDDAGLL